MTLERVTTLLDLLEKLGKLYPDETIEMKIKSNEWELYVYNTKHKISKILSKEEIDLSSFSLFNLIETSLMEMLKTLKDNKNESPID